MTQQERVFWVAVMMLAGSANAAAATAIVDGGAGANFHLAPTFGTSSSQTFSFSSPVDDADQLLSIGGSSSVISFEGGIWDVALHTTSGGSIPVYHRGYAGPISTFELSVIPPTAFAAASIDGITFTLTQYGGPSVGDVNIAAGTGTSFVFHVADQPPPVPEPTSLTLLLAGGLLGWLFKRRSL